jgi:hypothetical protein
VYTTQKVTVGGQVVNPFGAPLLFPVGMGFGDPNPANLTMQLLVPPGAYQVSGYLLVNGNASPSQGVPRVDLGCWLTVGSQTTNNPEGAGTWLALSLDDAPAFGALFPFTSVVTVPAQAGSSTTPIILNCSQADTFGSSAIFSPQSGRMTALPVSAVIAQ